jgi:TetR/AcrR family transcriptional regulator
MTTPERILDVALRLFAERGYDAVGVQEIVDASGITKPPLYHHFGSKQGVLEALAAKNYEDWFARLQEAAVYSGDLPLTVFNTAKAFFDFAEEKPVFHRLQHSMWYSAPESVSHRTVAPYLMRQHRLLEELFKKASKDHGNLKGHHTTYAITFTGMINGYITSLQSVNAPFTEKVVNEAVRQFMYGIFAL